jgi:hypothetical protein
MTETAARIAKAVLFLQKYEGHFAFLRDMKKLAATPGAAFTARQLDAIENCMRREQPQRDGFNPQDLEPGVYAIARGDEDADIYKVKYNKQKTRKYASRLVPISGTRLNEEDERVQWDWQYEPSAITKIRPYQRMGEDEAKHFGIKYGICAACGRPLSDAKSVENGIGPVCIKHFRF